MSASVPELVHRLMAAGRLAAGDVLDGRVRVADESRSHGVAVVRLDGRPVAVAKQAGPAAHADGDDPVAAERAVLPLVGDLGPRLLTGLGEGDVLWTEPLDLAPLRVIGGAAVGGSAAGAGAALPPVAALRALGAVLARLHAVTPLGMRIAPRPWVLDSVDGFRPSFLAGNDAALGVLDALLTEPLIAAAVARAGMAWRPSAVVHGDATLDNAHGAPSASPGRWTVRLVDFELAGLGAPVWDVVTAVDSIELTGVLTGADTSLAVAELLAGYQPARPLWRSWQPFRVARAVQTAVGYAAQGGPVDGLVSRALGLVGGDER